jgi:hypothetical protein
MISASLEWTKRISQWWEHLQTLEASAVRLEAGAGFCPEKNHFLHPDALEQEPQPRFRERSIRVWKKRQSQRWTVFIQGFLRQSSDRKVELAWSLTIRRALSAKSCRRKNMRAALYFRKPR